MKVLQTEVTPTKTAATLELKEELKGFTASEKKEVLDMIGELLVEQILDYVTDQKSPVTGNGFKPLSLEYSRRKKEEVGNTKANLDLSGDMLQALDYKIKEGKIEIGVYGSEAPKADGHNNLSGESKLPTRRFIPDKGQTFDSSIKDLIKETIDTYIADNAKFKASDLRQIESKSDLYEYLKDELGDLPRARLKELVLQSELSVKLDDFDLLDLL